MYDVPFPVPNIFMDCLIAAHLTWFLAQPFALQCIIENKTWPTQSVSVTRALDAISGQKELPGQWNK